MSKLGAGLNLESEKKKSATVGHSKTSSLLNIPELDSDINRDSNASSLGLLVTNIEKVSNPFTIVDSNH